MTTIKGRRQSVWRRVMRQTSNCASIMCLFRSLNRLVLSEPHVTLIQHCSRGSMHLTKAFSLTNLLIIWNLSILLELSLIDYFEVIQIIQIRQQLTASHHAIRL